MYSKLNDEICIQPSNSPLRIVAVSGQSFLYLSIEIDLFVQRLNS